MLDRAPVTDVPSRLRAAIEVVERACRWLALSFELMALWLGASGERENDLPEIQTVRSF